MQCPTPALTLNSSTNSPGLKMKPLDSKKASPNKAFEHIKISLRKEVPRIENYEQIYTKPINFRRAK